MQRNLPTYPIFFQTVTGNKQYFLFGLSVSSRIHTKYHLPSNFWSIAKFQSSNLVQYNFETLVFFVQCWESVRIFKKIFAKLTDIYSVFSHVKRPIMTHWYLASKQGVFNTSRLPVAIYKMYCILKNCLRYLCN